MTKEEIEKAELQSDMDGPLVDWQAKGHKLEFLGREKLPQGETYVLRRTLRSGDVMTTYLDATTFLEVLQRTVRKIDGMPVEIETTYSEYQEIRGLRYPFRVETGPKDSKLRQEMLVERLELDVPLEDSYFAMPVKPVNPLNPFGS